MPEPPWGLAEADPLWPEPLTELLPAVDVPVAPVFPDWVLPLVFALPDLADEPEFDEVVTAPDEPPFPELPDVATGLAVALPVDVDPVEPVLPEVAAALPLQLPTTVTQGATVRAGPEFPELPEFPDEPDVADPVEVADPVSPELASPDPAVVWLELVELASPVVPPVVVPLAVESPLWPDAAVAVDPSLACPVAPDFALPDVLPALPDPLSEPVFPWPQEEPWGGVGEAEPPCGVDVAEPLSPEPFCDAFAALAGPVDPVEPDCVVPEVSALPDLATDPEFDDVSTAPVEPPFPEFPDVATGSDVAAPVLVEPVDPVDPDEAFRLPLLVGPCPQGLEPSPDPRSQFDTWPQGEPWFQPGS